MRKAAMLGMAAVLTVAAGGCRREHRVFDPGAVDSQLANGQPQNEVHAGGQHMTPQPMFPSGTRYEDNAYAAAEGKRLFDAFNCSGCHQHGGGGIGPALWGRTSRLPAWRS